MKRIILYLVVFLSLSYTHVFASGIIERVLEPFKLFTNCESMEIVVEGLKHRALKLGLNQKSIKNVVESRIRSARLYSTNAPSNTLLYVNINVAGRAFNAELSFNKPVYDPFTGTRGIATTWTTATTGTHGNSSGFILSSLSRLMDEFLVAFLRVNDEACRKKK